MCTERQVGLNYLVLKYFDAVANVLTVVAVVRSSSLKKLYIKFENILKTGDFKSYRCEYRKWVIIQIAICC
jgi:hypothetical protein